jgi:hydroxyacylglutathione hydrolase
MGEDLVVEQLRLGPLWNFAYLVGSRTTGEAVVIDPGPDVEALLARAQARRLSITAAIATHFHTDHTGGLALIVQRTGATAFIHHADEPGLRGHYAGALRTVGSGARIDLGGQTIELWHAPGHTPGSMWVVIDGAAFTGDTLMVGCLGRAGFEDGAAEQMWRTFSEQFPLLPDETRIYPGHDYGPEPTSTAGIERRRNPGLTARTFDEFRRWLEP